MAEIGGVSVPTARAPTTPGIDKQSLVFLGLAVGGAYLFMQEGKKKKKAPGGGDDPAPVDTGHPAGGGNGVGAPPPDHAPDFMTACGFYYVDATKGSSSPLDMAKLAPDAGAASLQVFKRTFDQIPKGRMMAVKDRTCQFNLKRRDGTQPDKMWAGLPWYGSPSKPVESSPPVTKADPGFVKECGCYYDNPANGPTSALKAGVADAREYEQFPWKAEVTGGLCSIGLKRINPKLPPKMVSNYTKCSLRTGGKPSDPPTVNPMNPCHCYNNPKAFLWGVDSCKIPGPGAGITLGPKCK